MTKGLNEDSKTTSYIDSTIIEHMQKQPIRYLSLSSLAMSRIHLITSEEVERIYNNVSKFGRGGFFYGQEWAGPNERPLSGRSPLKTKYLSRTARRTATQSTRERPIIFLANGHTIN